MVYLGADEGKVETRAQSMYFSFWGAWGGLVGLNPPLLGEGRASETLWPGATVTCHLPSGLCHTQMPGFLLIY